MRKIPLFMFFRHHKSGGSWMSDICREVCDYNGLKYAYLGSAQEAREHGVQPSNCKRIKDYKAKGIGFISYGNAHIEYIKDLDNFIGFNMIRDPRDMLISGYFSHLYSHHDKNWPELKEHRKQLQSVAKDEGLLLEIDFMKGIFERLYTWDYSLPNILTVKFEEVTKGQYQKIPEIFKFLGLLRQYLPFREKIYNSIKCLVGDFIYGKINFRINTSTRRIPLEKLLLIIYKNSFSKKTKGEELGVKDRRSHYRKGISGDWKNHFSEKHKKIFKQRYADLFIKLGYETNNSW